MKFALIVLYILIQSTSLVGQHKSIDVLGYNFIVPLPDTSFESNIITIDSAFSSKVVNSFLKNWNAQCIKKESIQELIAVKIFIQRLNTNRNTKEHISYHILNKLGYDIKLLSSKGELISVIKTDIKLVTMNYFFYDTTISYLPIFWERNWEDNDSEIKIVNQSLHSKDINIDTKKRLEFGKPCIDSIAYLFNNKKYKFFYDKNYLEFANEVSGMLDGSIKANLPLDSFLYASILRNFKTLQEETDISNALIFCQKNITYKFDSDSKSEYLSPIQTIVRGTGDCEDKAILFSTMVAILTNKAAYVVEIGGKEGGFEHALSAFSVDNKLKNNIPVNIMYCEPSGYDMPVGVIREKYLQNPIKKFTKISPAAWVLTKRSEKR